jgi:hypothetical protein
LRRTEESTRIKRRTEAPTVEFVIVDLLAGAGSNWRSSNLLNMHFNDIKLTAETYDDDVALRAYVFKHFRHLMTPLERRTLEYNMPIVGGSDHRKIQRLYDFLEDRDGHVSDDAVMSALTVNYEHRKTMAINRIIETKIEKVLQNRCPTCKRLARTPTARQCMWCHCDWH